MSLRKQAAKGVIWSAAQTWGSRALSFLFLLILARLLDPKSFGLIAFASVFVAFAQIFADQGFSDAIVQFTHLDSSHLSTAFWTGMLSGFILFIIGIASSNYLAVLFKEPQLGPVLRWLSVSFLLSGLTSVQKAILRRKLAFKRLALVFFTSSTSSGFLAVILAFLGLGVWSLVAKMLINGAVDALLLWRVSDWRPNFAFSKEHFRQLFSFGVSITGSNFVDFFSRRSDDFLIGSILGSTALGYYTLAYNLLLTMTELLASVPNSVIFPIFSRLKGEPSKMRDGFYEATQLISVVAFPIFIGLSLLAPETVVILYGKNWEPSIPIMQVLMLIGILHTLFYFWGSILKASGRPGLRFIILTIVSFLNVIGFLLVVRFGIVAVAVVYVCVGYLVAPFYFYMIYKVIGVRMGNSLQQYIPALIGSFAMVLVVLGIRYLLVGEDWLFARMISSILLGAFVYISAIYLVKPSLYKKVYEIAQLAFTGFRSRSA